MGKIIFRTFYINVDGVLDSAVPKHMELLRTGLSTISSTKMPLEQFAEEHGCMIENLFVPIRDHATYVTTEVTDLGEKKIVKNQGPDMLELWGKQKKDR
jgi:hypothetical protein